MSTWGALCLACLAATAAAQLKVVSTEPVILRSGAGAARITLANTGTAAINLSLSTGTFIDETSHAKVSTPKVTLAMEAGGGPVPTQIGPGQRLQIVANVSNLTGSSTADALVFNQNEQVGTLTAVEVDVPLNVSLDGDGAPDKPLKFNYGRSAVITLKNGGAEFLTLGSRFFIDGTLVKENTIMLAPSGRTRLVVTPPKEVYSWKDFLRPTTRIGTLLLRLHGPDGVTRDLLPAQAVPVDLSMMRLGPDATEFWFGAYVTLVLFMGALLSLLGNSVLPNILKKIALRRQIIDHANRTSGVSTRVDSYLRVLLRLERKKIDIALEEVGPFSLSSTERFEDVAMAIDRLEKRLTVAERLDESRRRFEDASATAPPSITDSIDKTLQSASNQLHSFALADPDVTAANGYMDKADLSLRMLDDPDAQAKLIAANFKQLKDRLTTFPDAYFSDLKAALPGVFAILDAKFDDPKNLFQPMLFAVDHAIAAIQAALDYAMVRATLPAASSMNCVEPGKSARERLLERECELINLLGTLSWKALRAATTLVQQMREDIYESDVLEEIAKQRADGGKRTRVVFDTQKARPYLPVFFSIAFDDPRFKGAAALNWLDFRWNFPGDLTEIGPKVCHYFEGDEHQRVLPKETGHKEGEHKDETPRVEVLKPEEPAEDKRQAARRKGKGAKVKIGRKIKIAVSVHSQKNLDAPNTIEGSIEIQPRKPHRSARAFAEGVRFMITFGVALAGLQAGAMDQLSKLDFLPATIAVLALGFGADSIKNLLTQAPKKNA